MSESNDKVKKNNSKLVIVICAICFVVLCATIITIVAITSSKSKDSDKIKEDETIDIYGSDASATDEKCLDEVVAQVKNCISDASISNIKIAEGTYIYNSGEVISKNIEGAEFGELIAMALDGASIVSEVDPKKDLIKINIELNGDRYNVTAEFSKS